MATAMIKDLIHGSKALIQNFSLKKVQPRVEMSLTRPRSRFFGLGKGPSKSHTFVRIFLVVYNVVHPSLDIKIWNDDRVFCNSEIRKPEISNDDFTIWIVLGI